MAPVGLVQTISSFFSFTVRVPPEGALRQLLPRNVNTPSISAYRDGRPKETAFPGSSVGLLPRRIHVCMLMPPDVLRTASLGKAWGPSKTEGVSQDMRITAGSVDSGVIGSGVGRGVGAGVGVGSVEAEAVSDDA